jgi:hypothetical protein
MARPRFHLLAAAPAAWLAHRRWGHWGAAGALTAGVLIDLDHLVDLAWTRLSGRASHFIVPLHGWELAGVAAGLAIWIVDARAHRMELPDRVIRQPRGWRAWRDRLLHGWPGALLAGLATGWLLHLVQDLFTNRPAHAGVYSLAYRVRHGFRREITGWGDHPNFHGWRHLPWYKWL